MIGGTRRALLGALAIMLSVVVWLHPKALWAQQDRHPVGKSVPVFTLKTVNPDISGETYVSIDRYYGNEAKEPKKAVLMSFFASWCEPCKKEMPYLAALYDTYRDRGLQVLLITIDKETDKIAVARALAEDSNVKFPVLSDRFNIVARRYFIEKLPNVYVLNNQGKVAMVKIGYTDDVTRKLLNEVRKNIGQPVGAPIPEGLKKFFEEESTSAPVAAVEPQAANTDAAGTNNEPAANTPEKGKAKAGKAAKRKRKSRRKRKKK